VFESTEGADRGSCAAELAVPVLLTSSADDGIVVAMFEKPSAAT
jgi:hypothetical protein